MPTRLDALQILDRLIGFPTVSRDSNLALVDWVEDYLASFGIQSTRVWNAARDKASLFASAGPAVRGGVILSGHSDVVPVDGQAWHSDPWRLTQRDGRLFGRGTCDMKGFVALSIWALVEAARTGVARPLHLAMSHDEELGCAGAPAMIAEMVRTLPEVSAVLVGEPSGMKVVTGHKGGAGYHVRVRGYEVHSSLLHIGVSAVMEAARLVDWANRMNAANRAETPAVLAAAFDPPWTTLHVGTISGGTAANITAAECRFGFEFRVVPGQTVSDWCQRFEDEVARVAGGMASVQPGTGIDAQRYFEIPPLQPEPDGHAEMLARRLTGENATRVVSYGTEAGQFQVAGYSAVVCGPGDIAQAHQPDEFLTCAQFAAGEDFMRRLVEAMR